MKPRRIRRAEPPLRPRSVLLALALEAGILAAVAFLPSGRGVMPRALPVVAFERGETARVEPQPAEPVEQPMLRPEPEPGPAELPEAPLQLELVATEPPEAVEPPAEPPFRDADWLRPLRRGAVEPEPVVPEKKSVPPEPEGTAVPPQPVEGRNLPPPYPRRAIRLRQEGRVVLSLVLDPNGHVVEATVTQSSGSKLLDLVAQRALEKWWFTKGPGTVGWTVDFRLDGGGGRVSTGGTGR